MSKEKTKSEELALTTCIYTCFFPFEKAHNILLNKTFNEEIVGPRKRSSITKAIDGLEKEELEIFLKDSQKSFQRVSISKYSNARREEDENDLICRVVVDPKTTEKTIVAGKYCGTISFSKGLKLTIETGYSAAFLQRIINFCCGIYLDTTPSISQNTIKDSVYSLLVQYMFLVSLRKVIASGLPRKYCNKRVSGYSVKGNVDIERFINFDIISGDKKVSSVFNEQLEIQEIVDTIYFALTKCNFNEQNSFLPKLKKYRNQLKNLYSGKRPSSKVIKSAINSKKLNNSLYADYKLPLRYAKILIEASDINYADSSQRSVSGFLVDATLLWEMYLSALIQINFPDWDVESQAEINFYKGTIFEKTNHPDIVMTNKYNGNVFLLDAKFKTMNFDKKDIDNDDIQQVHSYSYFYHLKYKEKFLGAALVYPSKQDIRVALKGDSFANMFDSKESNQVFGILTIKDPEVGETIMEYEKVFVEMLSKMIGGN